MKKKSKKPLAYNHICPTCRESFSVKRKDSKYCSRLCYRRNPETAAQYSAKTNAYQKLHSREPERRFKKLKYKCSADGIPLSIDLNTYLTLIAHNCEYCDKSLNNETGCGLDRVNPKLGYAVSNVLPCCGACNQIRNVHLTCDEMRVAMKAVVEYRHVKEPANV